MGTAYCARVGPANQRHAGVATRMLFYAVSLRLHSLRVLLTVGYFDRIYEEHYPEEPGLLTTQQTQPGEVEALDDLEAQPEPTVRGDVSPASRQPGLHRRVLRGLRYIILPEMSRRISAPARGHAV